MSMHAHKFVRVASRGAVVRVYAVVLAMLFTVGCGRSKFEYAPVAGQILLDGNPVANARVVFMPTAAGADGEAGPYSNGETDQEGRYRLTSVSEHPMEGAVVGAHRVIVSTRKSHLDPNNRDIEIIDAREIIPQPYCDYRKTPLVFEVPAKGSASADFALHSNESRR